MRRKHTIGADYFEQLYRDKADPWQFKTSPYEREKYRHSLEALPRDTYESALEIGCSIGVFTSLLASRCKALLAVDVSETALSAARTRCSDRNTVTFARRQLPQDHIEGCFDLIVLSEVAYYWDRADLTRAAGMIREVLAPRGDLLLVHYTAETNYPLSGDDAVRALRDHLGPAVEQLRADRRDLYRLDVWRKSGGDVEVLPAKL